MALSIGASTFAETTGGTLTVNAPAGIVQNDILIAQIVINAGTADNPAITTLSGWTQVRKGGATNSPYMGTFYKIAGASEPSTYAWSVTNPLNSAVINITRVIGNSTLAPSVSSEQYNNTVSTTATGATVTPTVANSLIMMYIGQISNGGVSGYAIVTSNPSWTEQFDNFGVTTTAVAGAMATAIRPQTTATGNATATLAVSSRNCVHVIVIAPAPSFTAVDTIVTTESVSKLRILVSTVIDTVHSAESVSSLVKVVWNNAAKSVSTWLNQHKT